MIPLKKSPEEISEIVERLGWPKIIELIEHQVTILLERINALERTNILQRINVQKRRNLRKIPKDEQIKRIRQLFPPSFSSQ